jgi:putative endonuclease
MTYFIYILRSEMDGSFYVGYTANLEARVWEHNEGRTGYTSKKRPWRLIYSEQFETKTEALKREKFIKAQKSKAFIQALIQQK